MTFDTLYLDDPGYGVLYLCGFVEHVPIWEKVLLDCEGSVARPLHHSYIVDVYCGINQEVCWRRECFE